MEIISKVVDFFVIYINFQEEIQGIFVYSWTVKLLSEWSLPLYLWREWFSFPFTYKWDEIEDDYATSIFPVKLFQEPSFRQGWSRSLCRAPLCLYYLLLVNCELLDCCLCF